MASHVTVRIYYSCYFMSVCLCGCIDTMYIPGAYRGQKVSDLLILELQMVVSHNVGAENKSQVLSRSNKRSELLTHLSSSYPFS